MYNKIEIAFTIFFLKENVLMVFIYEEKWGISINNETIIIMKKYTLRKKISSGADNFHNLQNLHGSDKLKKIFEYFFGVISFFKAIIMQEFLNKKFHNVCIFYDICLCMHVYVYMSVLELLKK